MPKRIEETKPTNALFEKEKKFKDFPEQLRYYLSLALRVAFLGKNPKDTNSKKQ